MELMVPQSTYKRGMTLIEVFMVIGIIGILSVLVIISVRGSGGRANDAKAKNNATALAKAIEQYGIENPNGVFPNPTDSVIGAAGTDLSSLNSGLVGHYKLDEGTGGNGATVADSSATANNGTITGAPTWVNGAATNHGGAGDDSYALDFSGAGQYVQAPYSAIQMTAQFSLSVWTRVDALSVEYQSIVSARNSANRGYIVYVVESDNAVIADRNKIQLWIYNGVGLTRLTGPVVTPGTWYHVVVTYDGTNARLFVNNSLVAGPTNPGGYNSVAANFRIGAGTNEGPASFYLNGVADDVRLYNRALSTASPNEVDLLYQADFNAPAGGGVPISALQAGNYLAGHLGGTGAFTTGGVNAKYGTSQDGRAFALAWEMDSAVAGYNLSESIFPILPGGYVTAPNIKSSSLQFSGSGQYGSFNSSTITSADQSMCVWGNPTSVGVGTQVLAQYGSADANSVAIRRNGTALEVSGVAVGPAGANFWEAGKWKQVCVVKTGGSYVAYANGAAIGSPAAFTYTAGANGKVAANSTNGQLWAGGVDGLVIFSRALSVQEVTDLYLTGIGSFISPNLTGILGLWNLESHSTGTSTSAAGSLGNLTITGSPTQMLGAVPHAFTDMISPGRSSTRAFVKYGPQ